MTSTHYFNGRPFEVEFLDDDRVKVTREGTDYSVTTSWKAIEKWQKGAFIQNVMPLLKAEEREFLMTGLDPKQWDKIWSRMEDE